METPPALRPPSFSHSPDRGFPSRNGGVLFSACTLWLLAEFRAVGSVQGRGGVGAAGGASLQGAHPRVSRGFARRGNVCPPSGVGGSAGAPLFSTQLGQDRAVLLEEQVWVVHMFFKCVCNHLVCQCVKDSCLNRVTPRDSRKGQCGSLAHSFVLLYLTLFQVRSEGTGKRDGDLSPAWSTNNTQQTTKGQIN